MSSLILCLTRLVAMKTCQRLFIMLSAFPMAHNLNKRSKDMSDIKLYPLTMFFFFLHYYHYYNSFISDFESAGFITGIIDLFFCLYQIVCTGIILPFFFLPSCFSFSPPYQLLLCLYCASAIVFFLKRLLLLYHLWHLHLVS